MSAKPCIACGSTMGVHALGSANCLNRQILALRLTEHDLRAELETAKGALERYRVMYTEDTTHLQGLIDAMAAIIPKEERKRK